MLLVAAVQVLDRQTHLLGKENETQMRNVYLPSVLIISISLLQLLSALTGAPMDAGFVGNPNDYVFSQTALDNIISQLMEQTSG